MSKKLSDRQLTVLKEFARVGWCCNYPRVSDTLRALKRKKLIGFVPKEGTQITALGQRYLETQEPKP
jgi:hypothetical protein